MAHQWTPPLALTVQPWSIKANKLAPYVIHDGKLTWMCIPALGWEVYITLPLVTWCTNTLSTQDSPINAQKAQSSRWHAWHCEGHNILYKHACNIYNQKQVTPVKQLHRTGAQVASQLLHARPPWIRWQTIMLSFPAKSIIIHQFIVSFRHSFV